MAHIKQSRPHSNPDFQEKVLKTFQVVSSSIGSTLLALAFRSKSENRFQLFPLRSGEAGHTHGESNFTRTRIYDKYSGSVKITTHLDHMRQLGPDSGPGFRTRGRYGHREEVPPEIFNYLDYERSGISILPCVLLLHLHHKLSYRADF